MNNGLLCYDARRRADPEWETSMVWLPVGPTIIQPAMGRRGPGAKTWSIDRVCGPAPVPLVCLFPIRQNDDYFVRLIGFGDFFFTGQHLVATVIGATGFFMALEIGLI